MRSPRLKAKWPHGMAKFNHPALEDFIGIRDGFFPLRTILDLTLGEEVVLYLRDQTPFMEDLCRVRPFRLMLKTGVARNPYGPLAFLLFWVAHSENPEEAFAAYDVYLNPHSQTQVDMWRHLATQTHWHVFLVGVGGEQRGFFEMENTFALDDALDFILEACAPIQMVDFDRSKEKFMAENSIAKLLKEKPAFPEDSNANNQGTSEPSEGQSPFSQPRFQSLFQTSIERHLRETHVSIEDYLAEKRAELADYLADKKLIYLDTCHWVNLRHVMLQSPKLQAPYDHILGTLENLRRKERICCPLSQALFEELMKQTDPASRAATANLMDYLSGGVCVQIWIELIRLEWRQHVARILLGQSVEETSVNGFTKAGFWAGEHFIEKFPLPECPVSVGRKLYLDIRWAMTFHDYQALPGFTPTPDSMTDAFVQASAANRERALQNKLRFPELVERDRISIVNSMREDFFQILAQMCPPNATNADWNVSALMQKLIDAPTPWNMPTLQIVAGAGAAMAAKGQKTKAHDALDIIHAAVAIPYCDAYFCDNPMASLLCSKPLEYQKAYDTTIISQPAEIAAYLDSIS